MASLRDGGTVKRKTLIYLALLALAAAAWAIPARRLQEMIAVASRGDDAPWAPTDIATLVGWWDASDAASVQLDGSLITNWLDKSSVGRNAVPTNSIRNPYYVSGVINDLPGIAFATSSTDRANIKHFVMAPIDSTTCTVIAAYRRYGSGATSQFALLGNDNTTNAYASLVHFSDAKIYVGFSTGRRVSDSAYADDNRYVLTAIMAGNETTSVVRLNGSDISMAAPLSLSVSTSFSMIGFRRQMATGGSYLHYLGELMVFSSALATGDVANAENYLKAKWGIE